MKWFNFKSYVAGIVTMVLFFSATATFAETQQTINAIFGRVKLVVNGRAVNKETLLYNGTTYVPLRAAAEALDKDVSYDSNTNTAYINDKATQATQTSQISKPAMTPTQPTPENIVKGIGETWTLADSGKNLLKFTINSVNSTSDRNQFSKQNPAQVIIINYTYENIGMDSDLYILPNAIRVIDEKGNLAYSYPGSRNYFPKPTPKGAKCTAELVLGLVENSDYVTLSVKPTTKYPDSQFDYRLKIDTSNERSQPSTNDTNTTTTSTQTSAADEYYRAQQEALEKQQETQRQIITQKLEETNGKISEVQSKKTL